MTVPSFSFLQKPEDSINYLKNKGFKLSFDYDEMMHEAHHKAFTVAKVMRVDLLNDIHESLIEAQKRGTGFNEWKKNIKPTLKKKGWWGEKDITDPRTGKTKTIQVNSRRLKTIFETNMNVAMNVGRYKAQSRLTKSVYWRYTSALLPTSRDHHKALHGIIRHRDDPWWTVNYPPNGWHCKCRVRAYSEAQIKRRKWPVTEGAGPNIAHKDWAYDIGAGSRLGRLQKLNFNDLPPLPEIKKSKIDLLTDDQIKANFYKTLGIKEGEIAIDPVQDVITPDDSFFRSAKGVSKLRKRERQYYMKELAETIKTPDEIWLEWEVEKGKKSKLVKKSFRLFSDGEKPVAMMSVIKYDKNKTQNASLYFAKDAEKRRTGKLIYSKKGSDAAP